MTATILKNRPKVKAKAKPGSKEELAAMVDEIGALQGDLEILQAEPVFAKAREMAEKVDELKVEFRTRMDEALKPDQKTEIGGQTYVATVGAKANRTTVTDVETIHSFMGKDFYKIASVLIKDIKDYLNPEQREEVTVTDRTGTRSLKIAIK